MIRAIKTFVQAFFGVLIPAISAMLSNGWPESIDKAWLFLAPTVSAGLAAAIAAVWNIILEEMDKVPVIQDEPNATKPTDIGFIEHGFEQEDNGND